MSISEPRMTSKSSVQITFDGIHDCFLRSKLRLQMCVRRRRPSLRSHRILATALPTVPKPTRATRHAGALPRTRAGVISDCCSGGILGKVGLENENSFLSYVQALGPVQRKASSGAVCPYKKAD